ncbi:hypothetical protein MNBD_ALPHA09-766 [hydrothermal vent metagenome]|uniref:HTH gntR-type domain-containing protein n=1 Tax=hydrothermal vent metagenome TaxID=652676 RepID=A0A3B0T1I9_9ZZZZ
MTRLYRQVAAQIATLIDTGEYNTEDRLPAERHLSARLSVSRPTIREAIIALELSGLVDVRAGSGVYVINAPAARAISINMIDNAGASPLDVINARLDIECAIVGDAARNATQSQLDEIGATVARMERATQRNAFEAADHDFHVSIAEATGNSVLGPIVETLWTEMSSPIFMRMGRINGLVRENEPWAIQEHHDIHAALTARDANAAEAAMRVHLHHVRDFLQHDWKDVDGARQCLDAAE